MKHLRSSSKIFLLVIALIMATGGVLVAAKGSRETQSANLEELAQKKDDSATLNDDLIGPWRLEELGQIKDDSVTLNDDLIGPWRLEEPARTKDDSVTSNADLIGPWRLEEPARIKEDWVP